MRGDWVSIGLFACAALDAAAGVVSSATASGPMTSARLKTPPDSPRMRTEEVAIAEPPHLSDRLGWATRGGQ